MAKKLATPPRRPVLRGKTIAGALMAIALGVAALAALAPPQNACPNLRPVPRETAALRSAAPAQPSAPTAEAIEVEAPADPASTALAYRLEPGAWLTYRFSCCLEQAPAGAAAQSIGAKGLWQLRVSGGGNGLRLSHRFPEFQVTCEGVPGKPDSAIGSPVELRTDSAADGRLERVSGAAAGDPHAGALLRGFLFRAFATLPADGSAKAWSAAETGERGSRASTYAAGPDGERVRIARSAEGEDSREEATFWFDPCAGHLVRLTGTERSTRGPAWTFTFSADLIDRRQDAAAASEENRPADEARAALAGTLPAAEAALGRALEALGRASAAGSLRDAAADWRDELAADDAELPARVQAAAAALAERGMPADARRFLDDFLVVAGCRRPETLLSLPDADFARLRQSGLIDRFAGRVVADLTARQPEGAPLSPELIRFLDALHARTEERAE